MPMTLFTGMQLNIFQIKEKVKRIINAENRTPN